MPDAPLFATKNLSPDAKFSARCAVIFGTVYFLGTLFLLAARPLWLDEIHQLIGTRGRTFAECVRWTTASPGGTILPYLTQKITLDLFGFSTFTARLPAALCGVLSLILFYRIAGRLKLASPLVALFIFASLPLVFRYGSEARPYSQALATALLTLPCLLRRLEKPSAFRLALYGAACVFALYTQPFTLFFIAGQMVWLIGYQRAARRQTAELLFTFACAVLLYLPWAIYTRRMNLTTGAMSDFHFAWTQIKPTLLLRELAGGNFVVTLPLLILIYCGLRSARLPTANKSLLSALALATLLLPIWFDAAADFFFANRQLIFLQPVLALLAAEGASSLWQQQSRNLRLAASIVLLVFFSAAWSKNYRQAFYAEENWAAAAAALAQTSANENICLEFAPAEHALYYSFFDPQLKQNICAATINHTQKILVVSPYTTSGAAQAARAQLTGSRFKLKTVSSVGGTTFESYTLP